jgi:hypothetical protein
MSSESLDLSRTEDVLVYLANTPFASTHVDALSGGNANFVFRLHLKAPHEEHNTLVLKHAKSWVKWDRNFMLDVQRQVSLINFDAILASKGADALHRNSRPWR